MKCATPEPCRGRQWLQLVVLTVLLITGLLGMHALVGGPAAATASMASPAHASPSSPGMTGMSPTASMSAAAGAQGLVHGSGGCADAMNSGDSTCVSAPTAESIPALPVPSVADVLTPVSAPLPTPLSETPRRFALTHLELSIYRT
ncbi:MULTISPECIES: DUF6153 family protein [Dermacoccus]|uniref:DUF6153 family protein n=1 Tax=Dermacoccus TaxID=57495 RepID=UPI0006425130|nr:MULTISPECIES: DUF6153 family protein [Dermacoccus]MBZ4496497.1 DUF6153 family protein [Dermacoccus sp. Tok2021]QNK52091.1 hypothetical protein H7F30_10655 [Dermacoccus sp. PAMC28757]